MHSGGVADNIGGRFVMDVKRFVSTVLRLRVVSCDCL
jgi:hypothetical protein